MAKSQFTQEQIEAVVLEINAERAPKDIARKYGVSRSTLYRWRAKLADKRKPLGITFVPWRLKTANSEAKLPNWCWIIRHFEQPW